jgi:hypothetical protein
MPTALPLTVPPVPQLKPTAATMRAMAFGFCLLAAASATQAQEANAPVLASTWFAKLEAPTPRPTPAAASAPAHAQAAPAAASLQRRPVVIPARLASDDLRVVEDDHIRIEETRRNGQLLRVRVLPKARNIPEYDLLVRLGIQEKVGPQQPLWFLLGF